MNTHGIEVFNGADDYNVVIEVAHDLELKLFPPDKRFFNQHLGDRTLFNAVRNLKLEFFPVVSDSSACSSKSERRTNDSGKADIIEYFPGVIERVGKSPFRLSYADTLHSFGEKLPVLSLFDSLEVGSYHNNRVPVKDTAFRKLYSDIKTGLSAKSGKQGVRPLFCDYLFTHFRGYRLDISDVRSLGVGHNRCRV